MKKLIIVGTFIAGAVAGFFAGWKATEKYYANLAQEEIDSVKDAFGRRLDEIEEQYATAESSRDETELPNYPEDPDDPRTVPLRTAPNPLSRSSLDKNPYEQAKKNYSLVGQPYSIDHDDNRSDDDPEEEDDAPVTDDAGTTEKQSKKRNPEPYLISDEAYSNECDEHNKEDLYYYVVDDVLCDDQEQPITNIGGTVGFDAVAQLAVQPNVWVRNEAQGTDYQIIRVNKSYKEAVMGDVPQTPRSRRRAARQNEE